MKHNPVTIFHEIGANGQHRIIRVIDANRNEASDWAEHHQLAVLGALRANSGGVDHLPVGIFTTSERAHQSIT